MINLHARPRQSSEFAFALGIGLGRFSPGLPGSGTRSVCGIA
jgi:hypothetical protein